MLPIFDLSEFMHGDDAARLDFAHRVGEACESVGFFYVKNHGVPEAVIDGIRDQAKAFFDLPYPEKLKCERPHGRYRGYIPPSDFAETPADRPPVHYEAYLTGIDVAPDNPAVAAAHGMLIPNMWPDQPVGFRAAVETYQQGVHRVGMAVMEVFALALDDEAQGGRRFDVSAIFANSLSNISMLHYLARPDDGSLGPDDANAHHDTNAVTILLPSPIGGLEVLHADGTWIEAPPLEGCFVVNIGNMMQSWSGGRFKSTMHRVHPPLGKDRYSIGYFLVPGYDVVVEPVDPESVIAPEFCTPVHVGEDLARFVKSCDAMIPVYGKETT